MRVLALTLAARCLPAVILALTCLALPSCERTSAPDSESLSLEPAIARVDGAPVTLGELDRAEGLNRNVSRPERLEAVIRLKLAAAEARRRGLPDRDADLRRELDEIQQVADARQERTLSDALVAAIRDEISLSEAELRERFEATKSLYFSRQLQLRVALLESREAAEALDTSLGPEGRLDPRTSEDVGPATVDKLPRIMLPEILSLKEAGQRVIVEADQSWWLVELVAIHPAVEASFDDVRDRVEANLRTLRAQQAFGAIMDRLRAEADVVVEDPAGWVAVSPSASP